MALAAIRCNLVARHKHRPKRARPTGTDIARDKPFIGRQDTRDNSMLAMRSNAAEKSQGPMLHRRLSNDIWDKVRFQRCNLIPQGQFALLEPRKLKLIWHAGLRQSLDRHI
jgi:hypothetical protein